MKCATRVDLHEASSGLRQACVMACTNFLTIDQGLVRRYIGWLSDGTMRQIEDRLKTVLERP